MIRYRLTVTIDAQCVPGAESALQKVSLGKPILQ